MPISRDEFERKKIDPHLAVLDFLRTRHNYAFTIEEIRSSMASQRRLSLEVLNEILRSLENDGKIESGTIEDVKYFTYRRPQGPAGRRA